MRYSLLFLPLAILFLFSCSGGQEKSVTNADSTTRDSAVIANDSIVTSDEIINTEIQDYLRTFIIDYNAAKSSLPSVVYRESMEYDGRTNAYYFQDGKLRYISLENAAEGGFQEILVVKKETSGDVVLKTSTDGESSFTCIYKGIRSGYLVTSRNEPFITGITEPYLDDYSLEIAKQFKEIQNNENKFKKKEDAYEFDLMRKTVDSDYGRLEISKVYSVSHKFFETGLAKIFAANFMDPDRIKKIIGTWYPLHQNPTGYERHTLCGLETSIIVSEKDGKISWVEQGLQDSWEGRVVNIKENGDNDYEVALLMKDTRDTLKWPLAIDESRSMFFLEEKPYTSMPDRYNVVEKGEDCSEFD